MRTARTALSLLATLLLAGRVADAGSPRDALLVTTEWLEQHLGDPDLVLLHVGEKAGYEVRHLPGARFVATADLSVSDRSGKGLILEMPPPDDLRRRLEALGISDGSRIVVYTAADWVSPTTRILFTLDYAGLGNGAALLDGGMGAWVREGRPVTDVVPKPRAGVLPTLRIQPLVVDADFVRARRGAAGTVVVDARASAFYDGVETGGGKENPHRTGHIAGARSVPFTSLYDDKDRLRPAEELTAAFAKAGVKRGDTVIAYCHIGQQATAVLFAAKSLGHEVLLYDGSFEDWSRRPGFPVESPPKKE